MCCLMVPLIYRTLDASIMEKVVGTLDETYYHFLFTTKTELRSWLCSIESQELLPYHIIPSPIIKWGEDLARLLTIPFGSTSPISDKVYQHFLP